jgi:hypothetical protein
MRGAMLRDGADVGLSCCDRVPKVSGLLAPGRLCTDAVRRFRAKDENGSSFEEVGFFKIPDVARVRELIDALKKKQTG